jgi:deoxyribonuclease V
MKLKNIHPWNLSPKQAIRLQERLRRKIILKKPDATPKLIAAADAAFREGKAIGAVVVFSYPDFSCQSINSRRNSTMMGKVIESVRKTARISFPYIPGLLTFREGPVLEKCFRALKFEPEVIIFDGQGLAHPRNMGIATHLGILLDKPTIGCAKTWLFGKYTEPGKSRGAFSYLFDSRKRKIGVALRTKDNVRPLFVSAGNKIDLKSSIRIILRCANKYRIPEPLRIAHELTLQQRNKKGGWSYFD